MTSRVRVITEEQFYLNTFASHFRQLTIIFLWTSEIFHVACRENLGSKVHHSVHVKYIAHTMILFLVSRLWKLLLEEMLLAP